MNKPKKSSFSNQVLETLKKILPTIQSVASNKPIELNHEGADGVVQNIQLTDLPLDALLNEKQKVMIRQIGKDFKKNHNLENCVSDELVYEQLLKQLGSADVYQIEDINLSSTASLLEELKNRVDQEVASIKIIIIPVLGASLEKGEKCVVGSVEFINTSDFIESHNKLFEELKNSEEFVSIFESFAKVCEKCDLIAQLKITNRDSDTARNFANEIMKRVYTIIRVILPIWGGKYNFFGPLGEEFLDRRFFFLFKADMVDENKITSLTVESSQNRFSDNDINLVEKVSLHQQTDSWFSRCESIVYKFINNEKLTDFEKRVWTALYWLGEAMYERELNPLIIKYATCLEALFNSQEGGISQQISEFTAHVVGKTKDERMEIYKNVKKLYSLRSTSVHGASVINSIDDRFLSYIQQICERAVFKMAYLTGEDYYQSSNGYQKFVNYILSEHRFI